MGWDFINTNIVSKTRKPHRCVICNRIIPKGTKNIYHYSGMFNGNFQNSYICNWCEDHEDIFKDELDETYYDFDEIIIDEFKNIHDKYYDVNILLKYEGDNIIFIDEENNVEIGKESFPIQRKDE